MRSVSHLSPARPRPTPPRSRRISRLGPRSCATPTSRSNERMHHPPSVLGDVIERNARYFPGKTAVVFEERRVTFAEFAARARRFANALASYGLQRQARFAVLAQHCLEYFEAVGAAELTGFIAVTLNWRLSVQELEQIIADSTPTVLIFEAQFSAQAQALRRQGTSIERFIVIGAATDWAESYETVLAATSDAPPPSRPEPEDGVYLIYTSGTTGSRRASCSVIARFSPPPSASRGNTACARPTGC